eukprot:3186554-Prymnesium_polylepis.1
MELGALGVRYVTNPFLRTRTSLWRTPLKRLPSSVRSTTCVSSFSVRISKLVTAQRPSSLSLASPSPSSGTSKPAERRERP